MPSNSNNNSGGSGNSAKSTPMTKSDAARIQSTQARSGGDMSSGGFSSRAQSAGDRNANSGTGIGKANGGGKN